jgi:hypothetical protein
MLKNPKIKLCFYIALAVFAVLALVFTAISPSIAASTAIFTQRDLIWRAVSCGCMIAIFSYLALAESKRIKPSTDGENKND